MASYQYYLASYDASSKEEIGVGVYGTDEAYALAVGAVELAEAYDITVSPSKVHISEVEGQSSDHLTTT